MSFLNTLKNGELTAMKLQEFINSGANINVVEDGDNALQILINRNAPIELVKTLIEAGFDTTTDDGEYALTTACREDIPNYDLIVLLIESGCPVGDAFPDFIERIPHGEPADPKALQIVQLMLDNEADLEKTYNQDDTIFMLARNVDVLRVLIDEMKKQSLELLDEKNDDGNTALSLAEENGDDDIIALLKEEVSEASESSESSEDEEESNEEEEESNEEEEEPLPGALAAVYWSEKSTLAELIDILATKFGFTDLNNVAFKGKRKEPLLKKLDELNSTKK